MAKIRDHIRATITGQDVERLAKRREIRQRLSKLLALEQECDAIRGQIKAFNAREDQAVAEHQAATRPAQETLARIEESVAQAILNGEEIPDRLAAERVAALTKISESNAKLESQIEVLKKLRRNCNERLRGIEPQLAAIPRTRGELAKVGIASTELLQTRFVAERRRFHAERRLADAQNELQRASSAVSRQVRERESHDVKNSAGQVVREAEVSDHERRLERDADAWSAELLAATEELQKANAEVAKVRAAIVDE